MAATISDNTLLRDFAQGATTITGAEVANAVSRIAQTISTGISQESRDSARQALTHLSLRAHPDAIPALLSVCKLGVSLHLVDAFLLASAAWKAVVATCVTFCEARSVSVPTRLQVLHCAIESAQSLLHGMMARSRPGIDGAGLVGEPLKALKIARFHCSNAARCAKAFAMVGDWGMAGKEGLAAVACRVLQLVAYVFHVVNFEQGVVEALRREISQSIAPALGATLRFVLSIICSFAHDKGAKAAADIIARSLEMMLSTDDQPAQNDKVVSQGVLQLFAILHLMRYSLSELSAPPQSQTTNTGIQICRTISQSILLPSLLTRLQSEHTILLSTKHCPTSTPLLEIIYATAEQHILLTDANNTPAQHTALHNLLLTEQTSPFPTRALLSSRILLHLTKAAHTTPARRASLLQATLHLTQTATTLCPGHAERRWIPLASAQARIILQRGEDLATPLQTYLSSHAARTHQTKFANPTFLHVLVALCDLLCTEPDCGRHASQPDASRRYKVAARVLTMCKLDQAGLTAFVKRQVAGETGAGAVAEAAMQLVPYVLDRDAGCEMMLRCLGREGSSLRSVVRVLNGLEVQTMSGSERQRGWVGAEVALRRFGVDVCAVIAGLVGRMGCLLRKGGLGEERVRVGRLVEGVIVISGRGCLGGSLGGWLRRAATLGWVGGVLEIGVSDGVRDVVEAGLERVQGWRRDMEQGRGLQVGREEGDVIREEVRLYVCARRKESLSNTAKRLTLGFLGMGGRQGCQDQHDVAAVKAQVGQLWHFLDALEGAVER